MGIWFMMLGIDLLIPAILLVAGRLMEKKPPRKINGFVGYRTAMSMKNQDTWDFANKKAGAFMWKWGWVTLAATVAAMLLVFGRSETAVSAVGNIVMFAQLIPVIAVIPYAEKALDNTFDQEGKRKDGSAC